nr:hypothetical protein [Methanobrevibacter arboriphilus]
MLLNLILISIIILLIIIIYLIVRWSYRIIGATNKTFQKTARYSLAEIKQLERSLQLYKEHRNEQNNELIKIDNILVKMYKKGYFNNTVLKKDIEDWLMDNTWDVQLRMNLIDNQKYLNEYQGGFDD